MALRNKVQISKTSWHYRFMDRMSFHPEHCRDLCSYLQKFFGLCALLGYFTIGPFAPLITWSSGAFPDDTWTWLIVGVAIGIIAYAILLYFGIVLLVAYITSTKSYEQRQAHKREALALKKLDKQRKERQPSIITLWAHAFHEKTCPLVEINDPSRHVCREMGNITYTFDMKKYHGICPYCGVKVDVTHQADR